MATVSVVIPAYAASKHIEEALRSVLGQSYAPYEIIVVNDGSPDTEELRKVLEPYGDRIVYLKQENRGPGGARNTGVRKAEGQYVAFLDSDDIWMPHHLDSQVTLLEGPERPDLVYGNVRIFGDSPLAGETTMERHPSEGRVTFRALLEGTCTVTTTSVVARRSKLVDAGLFDESFRLSEDFDLWLRMAHSGCRMAYQNQVLAHHREHAGSLTAKSGRLQQEQIRVLEKLLVRLPLTEDERNLVRRRISSQKAKLALVRTKGHLAEGDYEAARRHIRKASQVIPSFKYLIARAGLRLAPGLLQKALTAVNRRRQSTAQAVEEASDGQHPVSVKNTAR